MRNKCDLIMNQNLVKISRDPQKGRVVLAALPLPEGMLISTTHCIQLSDSEMPRMASHSPLWSYVFSGKSYNQYLVALSWVSLMNHSDDPNVTYVVTSPNTIEFTTLRPIKEDEELCINYGYDPLDHNNKLGIDMQNWNKKTMEFDGMMGASQMGVDLGDTTFRMIPESTKSSLLEIRKRLLGGPRTTKEAFNIVLNYFAGLCPAEGCVQQDAEGNWRIISNRTGEYWKQKYQSRESAENALKAYHASK